MIRPPIVKTWTGRHAHALQSVLGVTAGEFADRIGVSVIEVASWRLWPGRAVPRSAYHALDAAALRLTGWQRARLRRLLEGPYDTDPAECVWWCAEHDTAAGLCTISAGPVILTHCPVEGTQVYLGDAGDLLPVDEARMLARRVIALTNLDRRDSAEVAA